MKGLRGGLIGLFAVAAALLGTSAPDAGSALAAELKPVTVRLAFSYNAHRSPYLLGVDKGFYEEVGLDVSVLEGKGVTYALQLAANKDDTFAIVDPPSLMLGIAAGMPLKQVVQLYQRSPNALISWKEANIETPNDLVGQTVASLQGDTTTTMLYALFAHNNIDRSEVNVFAADGGTRNQTFLSKRAKAITGFYNDSYLGFMEKTGGQVDYFLYADYGIDTMGDGVAAHIDTIEGDPELVRAFVNATIRSYEYALAHPKESVAALQKRVKKESTEVSLQKIKATKDLVYTSVSEKHGVGYSDFDAWKAAEDLMMEFGGLTKRAESVEDYYTNEFLN